ncbi:CgeB family protein [Oribacterium sp. WCC10]|uniref:CgeB family protein n=1 Tax=Oribacterium sp. WCC10 TaxID=1855343 RepID=UPI0008ED99BA|nr:DUF3880 domain-containing protein [Oribacterium sp. WCC10]SFG24170.1 spore maturation protein CgeB [Oribacterium sp. WCC10]
MKVFFININSFGNADFTDALSRYKHSGKQTEIYYYPFENHGERNDPEREEDMYNEIKKESPDFAFSFNYYPIVSKVCQKIGLKYISWVYDNPHIALYSYTLINSCNEVFLFDSKMYEDFASQGIKTVHYMPLAASVRRLDSIKLSQEIKNKYHSEVCFIGSLYTEDHNFYERMVPELDSYTKGYLEGLMRSQMQIQGYNFIQKSIDKKLLASMYKALPIEPNADGAETQEYIYADYVINRRITGIERLELLKKIGERWTVDLYTKDETVEAPGVRNHGIAQYYETMPYIFKCADINLNITLRSIQKGIPLRCFDIMGVKGFLISNYQEDLLRYFEPDKDFVFYESPNDLMEKIEFYLANPEKRQEIADRAYEKIKKDHTFDIRVRQILELSGIT